MSYKKYKTTTQLIKEANKKLSISMLDENMKLYEQCFYNHSYGFIINGFKESVLYDKESKKYKSEISFEVLYALFIMTTKLNHLLLNYILHVEHAVKFRLSKIISEKYGDYVVLTKDSDKICYLNYTNYSGSSSKKITKNIRYGILHSHKNSYTSYYHENHLNIPPWVMINDIPLGKTIKWISILKLQDKEDLIKDFFVGTSSTISFDAKYEYFIDCLKALCDFRNRAAHGNIIRAVHMSNNIPFKTLLKIYKNAKIISLKEKKNGLGNKDYFSILLSMNLFLVDRNIWNKFSSQFLVWYYLYSIDIQQLFSDEQTIVAKLLEFPINIESRINKLTKFTENRFNILIK